MNEKVSLSGKVSRVFRCYPDSPWSAGKIMLDAESSKVAGRTEFSFAGKLAAREGDLVTLHGPIVDSKYGRQIDVQDAEVRMDQSPDAIVSMLASHKAFKGIGRSRAQAIVEAAAGLGSDGEILTALTDNPETIAALAGVSEQIVKAAAEVYGERSAFFDAVAAVTAQGWTNAQAQSIVDRFGTMAARLVAENPYQLIGKVARFGFKTVDAVALKMGISPTHPLRIRAGVAYSIDAIAQNGDTYTERPELVSRAFEELRPDSLTAEDEITSAIEIMIADGELHSDVSPVGNEIIASRRVFEGEQYVFRALIGGMLSKCDPLPINGERASEIVASLNEGQRYALASFSDRLYSVVSGGAGVGKTYLVRSFVAVAKDSGLRVALCAPTGKASRRLERATHERATTIHKLLAPAMDPGSGEFRFTHDETNTLPFDLVVVDEVSMVDVSIMRSLLRALKPTTRLLLVGDHHQIPSVGAGAILRDLLSATQPGVSDSVSILTDVVRQAGELARNTSAILDGHVGRANDEGTWVIQHTTKGDEESSAAHVSRVVEWYATTPGLPQCELAEGQTLDIDWDVQVLAPMRKGPLGVYALNAQIQRLRQRMHGFAEPDPIGPDERPKPLVGDKVIWTKNDSELDLQNGTQAILAKIEKGGSVVLLVEDGREVKVPAAKRKHLEVAWAITIHKSQGSEWPVVVLIASSTHYRMLDRNLFYTGASRAAQVLAIVGDQPGIHRFATNQQSARRKTFGSLFVHGWEPKSEETQDLVPGSSDGGWPFDG